MTYYIRQARKLEVRMEQRSHKLGKMGKKWW